MEELSERLQTPISTAELERRWAAVRAAMERDKIDVLLMQNNNDHMGGYVKYFSDLPATNGYPLTVVFPRDDLMTLVSQGPFGGVNNPPATGDGRLGRQPLAALGAAARDDLLAVLGRHAQPVAVPAFTHEPRWLIVPLHEAMTSDRACEKERGASEHRRQRRNAAARIPAATRGSGHMDMELHRVTSRVALLEMIR